MGHSGLTAGAVSLTSGTGNITVAQADANSNTKLSALTLNSAGGDIMSSGSLNVTGATILNAGDDISLTGANQIAGTLSASGDNIQLGNTTATQLGNISATGNLTGDFFGDITQADNTALQVTGTTNINGESNDVTLMNAANLFGDAVSISGNNISLNQQAGNDLSLDNINAAGNVIVTDNGGTLAFTGSNPTLELRNGISNKRITLAAQQFNNQNSGSDSTIDLGTGTGNDWQFYLSNVAGNTFHNLSSGNQAIWGTSYPTAISQSGNRYIFATPQTLSVSPESVPFRQSKDYDTVATLPTPTPTGSSSNYQVSGFVDAALYDNAFTQDTVNNVPISGLSFMSAGTPNIAPIGTYTVNVSGTGTTTTGYGVSLDPSAVFGNLSVIAASGENPADTSLTPSPQNPPYISNNPATIQNWIQSVLPPLFTQKSSPELKLIENNDDQENS